jgi:hypothetical protein
LLEVDGLSEAASVVQHERLRAALASYRSAVLSHNQAAKALTGQVVAALREHPTIGPAERGWSEAGSQGLRATAFVINEPDWAAIRSAVERFMTLTISMEQPGTSHDLMKIETALIPDGPNRVREALSGVRTALAASREATDLRTCMKTVTAATSELEAAVKAYERSIAA